MIPRRLVSVLLAGAALASAALIPFVFSGASFSGASASSSGQESAAIDFVKPAIASAVLAKTSSGVPAGNTGAVHQGGTYRVYASVSDYGGLASVTADLSSITTGQTAAAMASGSYTVGGTTYNYRSAELTANAALSAGTKSWSVRATDTSSNVRTTSYSATVDNTAPAASMTDPGAYLRGTVSLGATASDGGAGLESLAIRIAPAGTGSWTNVCSITTSPASCPLVSTLYTDGSYDVQALATDNAGNSTSSTVSGRTIDNAAPAIARTVLVRTTSATPEATTGYVHQGGTYRVYAQTSDVTSGLSAVNVDASSVTTGATAMTMTAGSYTVGGQTYNYASAELTANAGLAPGAKTVTVTATDNATNTATSTPAATVDNTAPSTTMSDPGAYLKGTVSTSATASDAGGSGIESLKIRVSPTGQSTWTTVCATASSPASCSLVTNSYTDGGYDVQSLVIDGAGNATTSTVGNRVFDNTNPSITRTVLVRTTSGTPAASTGFLHQGGTYRIYSQASDATSGLASVTANASTLTTGQTAATMTAGSYTVAGQTYNYASAELTANAAIAEGAKIVTVTATDNATNVGTLSPSATVDNTAPATTMNSPGTYIKGTISLGATASDGSAGPESLVIQRSPTGTNTWTQVCSTASSPASCSFDSTTVTDGGYDFQSLATDKAGNTATSTQSNETVDNAAPVFTRSVFMRTASGTPASTTGFVKQGGTYRIYAQVSDATSGVSTVTVNASNVTTGQTAATMTAGSYTVGGQTYNYASAELTANATLSEGAKTVTVTATDNATNAGTSTPSATVDNTAPSASMTDPGAYMSGVETLNATGSDAGALESLVIQRSPTGTNTWTTVCTVASSPASCSFTTTTVTDGGYDLRVVVTDGAGNTGTSTVTNRIVDNTPPTATGLSTTNKTGGTAGKVETGDMITYTFSEAMDPNTILPGWDGTSISTTMRWTDGTTDSFTFWDGANTTQLNLGTVSTTGASNYVGLPAPVFTGCTMVMSGSTITITIGTLATGGKVSTGGNSNFTWTPSTPLAPTDLAGNSQTTTAFAMGGAAAKRF